mmetsp:Transcript_41420/g.130418  ORF Transcript_41420/g.130418 Transcript_41420/m.130418 type:complete len:196 (+) Transcript_41420:699-1286(+)
MIVGIIFYNTIPIFSETIMLLMESAPNDLCSHASTSHELQELIKEQQGVVDVHELHVWRLAQDVNICSMHVIVDELHSSDLKVFLPSCAHLFALFTFKLLWKLQDDIKHLLHECSIHASSLQFEPMRSKQSNSEFNCVDPVCDVLCLVLSVDMRNRFTGQGRLYAQLVHFSLPDRQLVKFFKQHVNQNQRGREIV